MNPEPAGVVPDRPLRPRSVSAVEPPMSFAEAAAELGEREDHVRWLVGQGRLPYPPTWSSLRRYREETTGADAGRIQPGTLRHLYHRGVVTVSSAIPAEDRDRIDILAEDEGITRAAWIARAINDALQRQPHHQRGTSTRS